MVTAAAGAVVPLASAASDEAPASALSIYTQPQRMVEVEPSRKLNLVCIGEGTPTVVFESGLGEPTSTWSLVQPRVARHTRACSYDRAGVGFSDPGGSNGSSADIVADLKRLLGAASIAPPYVLVGQSYGGMNARLYFYQHPDEVAGLVLVEPAHEDQDEGFRLVSPRGVARSGWVALRDPGRIQRAHCVEAAAAGVDPASEGFKGCIDDPPQHTPDELKAAYREMQTHAKFQRAQEAEELSVYEASVEQLRAARRGFKDLPVIVLSRSPDPKPLRDWETPHLRDARYRFWLGLHQGLADSSSRGEHRVVPDSDHVMQFSQPDAVVTAIEDMLAVVRKGSAPAQP